MTRPDQRPDRPSRLPGIALMLALVPTCTGCGTVLTRTAIQDPDYGRIYSGTALDLDALSSESVGPLFLFDIPLSLVADSVLLPLTLLEHFFTGKLQKAAGDGDLEEMRTLLEAGFELDESDVYGQTALIAAARGGQVHVVEFLLDQGARVDATTKLERSALHYACRTGHAASVRALLDAGADLHAVDGLEQSPLEAAAAGGHVPVVQELLDRGALATDDERGATAVMEAAREGEADAVKLLVDRGADFDPQGGSVLRAACSAERLDVVRVLVEAGADVNAADARGYAPLHRVRRDPAIVRLLLDAGADPAALNDRGKIPADYAKSDEVRALLGAAGRP